MKNLYRVKTALFALTMLVSMASRVDALDLLQAYEQARFYDAEYMTALSSYEAARLDLPLAQSANRPSLAAGLGLFYRDDTLNLEGRDKSQTDSQQGEVTVDLNQNLYSRDINYDIDSAEYAVIIAQLQLGIANQDLIARTVVIYLDVLAALDNEHLADLERTAIEQQLDLATQRLEVGLGTTTDQYDARGRFEAANAELIAAQNEVINAQQALEALMGQLFQASPRKEMETLDNDKVSWDLVAGDAWVDQALQRNLEYQIKQRQIDIQKIEIERSKAARVPRFGLVAGFRGADASETNVIPAGTNQNWLVGIQGSMPIYQGGSIKLRQNRAGHAYNAASYEAEQARRDADRLIRAARRGVETFRRQVQALKDTIVARKSAMEAKEEGFKAGVTTNLDVLNAQRDLFRSGRDYLRVSYDMVNAIVILERAAGELDGEDVVEINSWLK